MCDRWGWGVVCILGLAALHACGGDSSPKPDAGAQAGDDARAGSGGTSSAGSGGASGTGTGGGDIVPARGCPLTAPKRSELGSKLEKIEAAVGARAVHMTVKGLFWATDRAIYHLQSDGSGVQVAQGDDVPDLLTSNATLLGWHGTTNGMLGIWTAPLDGGTPTMVTAANIFVEALALDDTHAYFGGSASDGLRRASLAGGTSALLANPFGVDVLSVGGGYAYYVEGLGETVMRVATSGGAPEPASPEIGMVTEMVLDASAIYAATLYSIYRIERGQPSSSKVLLALAQPNSRQNNVIRLLDDGDRLVFADLLDNIGWVTKDGKSCGYIVSEGKKDLVAIPQSDIAVDAQYLYLADWPTRTLSRIKRADIGIAR